MLVDGSSRRDACCKLQAPSAARYTCGVAVADEQDPAPRAGPLGRRRQEAPAGAERDALQPRAAGPCLGQFGNSQDVLACGVQVGWAVLGYWKGQT